MSEIIAFVSPKGGSGATFACAGVWLAFAKRDKKVLAVDLCGKRSALDFALGFQNDSFYNVADVINGVCSLNDALCTSQLYQNASFLRGSAEEKIDVELLKSLLSGSSFEYILFDVSNNDDAFEILSCTDKNIVVTDCSEVSVRMCDAFASSLKWDKSYIIINKIIPSYIVNKLMPTVDEIVDGIGMRPIGLLPWQPNAEAVYGSSLEYIFSDKNIAKAFNNISVRLEGEMAAAIDFDTYYDCFKIKKRR